MLGLKRRNYTEITEFPGQKATREQLERLLNRYRFAQQFAIDKDVLEVGFGSGIGLEYLSKYARKVAGCDIDAQNVSKASQCYGKVEKIEKILCADAHNLPFEDDSFDLVVSFETIYYLKRPEVFISESRRVLREKGMLLIGTVNKDWKDFHPSRYSVRYLSVPELYQLLRACFEEVEVRGAFAVEDGGVKGRVFSFLKRAASKARLIPGSLKAREFLKRLFVGELYPIPERISDEMADYKEPVPIDATSPNHQFKIIYAIAR